MASFLESFNSDRSHSRQQCLCGGVKSLLPPPSSENHSCPEFCLHAHKVQPGHPLLVGLSNGALSLGPKPAIKAPTEKPPTAPHKRNKTWA